MAISRKRVFCVEESIWSESKGLTDQTSVLPTLELLERLGVLDAFVHRHAVGSTEFENYLVWRKQGRRIRTFGTLYFAFHGTPDGLAVGDRILSLEELGGLVGALPGGVVHLGSCSMLRGNEGAARDFLQATGARAISGYETDVDWLDSAAVDTAWLGYLARYERLGDAERWFRARYASVIEHLGWRAVTGKR